MDQPDESRPTLKLWELDAEPDLLLADAPWEPAPASLPVQKPVDDSIPPSPEKILEAILFVGGQPLTFERASQAVRGLTDEIFRATMDEITKRYRKQNRPYRVHLNPDGYLLDIQPAYRYLRESGDGPREVKLTQAAVDVLGIIAYEQPIALERLEAMHGIACGPNVKQLIRLGLVATQKAPKGSEGWQFVTTQRFLERFELASLADLPKFASGTPG